MNLISFASAARQWSSAAMLGFSVQMRETEQQRASLARLQRLDVALHAVGEPSTMPPFYPSILFQERVLGFAMGGLVGMGVFMYEQRQIWTSTAGLAETLSGGVLPPSRGVQAPPPIFGKEARDDLAHVWNSTIDKMFGSLISSLSSKGW